MGRKEYGRLGLGPNCSDAKELTLVSALSSMKCIDISAGSAQSFAVTELGIMIIMINPLVTPKYFKTYMLIRGTIFSYGIHSADFRRTIRVGNGNKRTARHRRRRRRRRTCTS